MKKWSILMAVILALVLLLACGAPAPEPVLAPAPAPEPTPAPAPEPEPEVSARAHLIPNPVEASMPIYGGILTTALNTARSFDGHQAVSAGQANTLPCFNQLVMFDCTYKEAVPENIIGDLAESWEISQDGTEITFKLHQGVKWHDGMPFTAADVVYSLDKMTDINRSAISGFFPAYVSSEVIDDNTVKVHLKYASAGFMLGLANGESVIQAKHLTGTDDQSADFMVGTGPFILTEYLTRVHLKFKRNPDYFKKDQYGNQLPYLDGLNFLQPGDAAHDVFIARRLDLRGVTTGISEIDSYNKIKDGAPEALLQTRTNDISNVIYINMQHKPLSDIRVRRAMALVLEQDNLIVGSTGDVMFGTPGAGLLKPAYGLPKEEVARLMGWDKPMDERVAEAQKLMAEAGYSDGFKLKLYSAGRSGVTAYGSIGTNLVFAEALRNHLKIESEIQQLGFAALEEIKKQDVASNNVFTASLRVGQDPALLSIYFGTDGYSNWAEYANPDLDNMLAEVDHIIDPVKRQETLWAIERILLTDLPALPTGNFNQDYMLYYPHVKNLRWTDYQYSNVCRLEDVWIDESLRVK